MTLEEVFAETKKNLRAAYIPYLTAGFPRKEDTAELLLALQRGGADIIELGVPFSDPIADGPTNQRASFVALQNGTTLVDCFNFVREARSKGLTVPIVLMSYYNPLLAFGEDKLIEACAAEDVNICGLIAVDIDFEDFKYLSTLAIKRQISLIPLVAPTTTNERLKEIAPFSHGYVYCVSVAGVTGARTSLPEGVEVYTARIKEYIDLPRALGFGLSTPAHFAEVGRKGIAEGVIMGSKVIKTVEASSDEARASDLEAFVKSIMSG